MVRLLLTAVVISLAALFPAPARAENPRVSLHLVDVTGAEALAALSKESRISLSLPDPRFGRALPQVEDALKQRATFDWRNVRFAAALRQLCERFNLRPNVSPAGTYALMPGLGAPPAPAKPVGLVEKEGLRFSVKRISISTQREIAFEDLGFQNGPGNMGLWIGGRMLDGDAESFAGITNLRAQDDLGNILMNDRLPWRPERSRGGGAFPDEFGTHVMLPAPHPKARKLNWLEGDVLVHRTVRPLSIEIPLPLPERGATRELHGVAGEVTRVENEPDGPDENPFNKGRVTVQARLVYSSDSAVRPHGSGVGTLALVGASGKVFSFASGSTGGTGGATRMTYNYSLTFSGVDEPVKAVVFRLIEKSEPERLMSFRMANIPLPGDPAFVPQRAQAQPMVRPGAPMPERPFHAAGGGVLVSRVRINGKPAPEGVLLLGLAAREGSGWSGMRWTDVPVDADGVARYPDLKPGTYRILRVYRMKRSPTEKADGAWKSGEAVVEITAGKESTAPELTWTPLPAGKAKP